MTISGFTFVKNASKLYIPAKEAILSVLPICDEFVIAIGDNDVDDTTMDIINSIGSDKIKIVHTKWDTETYVMNTEFARQTDIAKDNCTGDWLFYIQCDEAIHENDLPKVKSACETYMNRKEVEGLLFKYFHFWGDYQHYHDDHVWYKKEIRVIRNDPKIHSWKDAQSFRKFDSFDGSFNDYQKKEDSTKLNVIELDAHIYHYGYVRPPAMMTTKNKKSSDSYRGAEATKEFMKDTPDAYDYGPLNKLKEFNGQHPKVMTDWIMEHDWTDELQYAGSRNANRPKHKHEKTKYKVVSWVENSLNGGKVIGGFKNYNILGKDDGK
jgi:hypothetical protein